MLLVAYILKVMIKILAIAVILIASLTGFAVYKYFQGQPQGKIDLIKLTIPVTTNPEESQEASETAQKIIDNVEKDSASLPANLDPNATSEQRIAYLTSQLSVLQRRIDVLEKNQALSRTSTSQTTTTQTTTSQSSNPPLYIPFGSGGSFTDRVYANFGGYIISVDPTNYAGYKSMQLEVTLRLNAPSAASKARLFNSTDNSVISNSEVSTTSTSYTLLTSGTFTLPAGTKTYQLQVFSTDGMESFIQTARIKVNY